MPSVRALAAQVIAEVVKGHSLDAPLEKARTKLTRSDDRGLLGALVFGAVRHFYSNRALARAMLKKPGQKLEAGVEALLILGIEQLRHTRVPPHAAVAETVSAARGIGLKRATGFTNALLRRFTRERDALLEQVSQSDEVRYEHPHWLLEQLREHWPDDWQAIVEANNRAAPMWLRVDMARGTAEDYAASLQALPGVEAVAGRYAPGALRVTPALAVPDLPGFDEGRVSVQDQSAQIAAQILAPRAGERILDACAAPGGKTGHLLEMAEPLDVVAIDCAPQRLERLNETLARQGRRAEVLVADLSRAGAWQELAPFDKILLDAPCTGSGVIRRHPDIKVLRRAEDSAKLSTLQSTLLGSAWHLLKPGGSLLYATCSVLPTENDDVVAAFLAATPDADRILLDPPSNWGRATRCGRQVFPGEDASDGFYYAYIEKRS